MNQSCTHCGLPIDCPITGAAHSHGPADVLLKLGETHGLLLRVVSALNCADFKPVSPRDLYHVALEAELTLIRAVKMLGGYSEKDARDSDKPHG